MAQAHVRNVLGSTANGWINLAARDEILRRIRQDEDEQREGGVRAALAIYAHMEDWETDDQITAGEVRKALTGEEVEVTQNIHRMEAQRVQAKLEAEIHRLRLEREETNEALAACQAQGGGLLAEVEKLRAEVKRLQAEMRSLATSNGNTINDLEADLHMALAKIDTALTLIENRSLNTTSASVMGNVIAALEGK